MDKTKLHITEYRGDQEIQFFGITSFKVHNHGEAVVEINTIPIYPNQTVKIIEEDGTQCDFKLAAKFTESGKMPKFKTIYKQFGDGECVDLLNQNRPYTVTLYNYEVGDVINFSQNMSGHTTLTRSYDGGQTFLPENDIDLGFVEANQIVRYDSLGSLHTNSIQFRNNDLQVNSEIFTVREVNNSEEPIEPLYPFDVYSLESDRIHPNGPNLLTLQNLVFTPNKSGDITLEFTVLVDNNGMMDPEYIVSHTFLNCEKDVPVVTADFVDWTGLYNYLGSMMKFTNITTNEEVVKGGSR